MGKEGSDRSPVPLPRDQPDFAADPLSPLGQRLSWHCWGARPWLAPHFFLSVEAAPLPPRQGPDALVRVTLKISVKKKNQCVKAMPASVPMSWQFRPLVPTFLKTRDKGVLIHYNAPFLGRPGSYLRQQQDSDFAEVKGIHCTSHPLLSFVHSPGIRLIKIDVFCGEQSHLEGPGCTMLLGPGNLGDAPTLSLPLTPTLTWPSTN